MAEQNVAGYSTPYKFMGKELDEERGLYYFGASYYDPVVGIWYGVDPSAFKYPSHSPYAYCLNNPIRHVDPDGKDVYTVNTSTGEIELPKLKVAHIIFILLMEMGVHIL